MLEFLKQAPEFLKHGLLGLGMFLSILSFYLIYIEQKEVEPRRSILNSTYIYMLFSIVILLLGLYSEINMEDKPLTLEELGIDTAYTYNTLDNEGYKTWDQPTKSHSQFLTLYSDDELWRYIETNSNDIEEIFISGAHLQNGVGRIRSAIRSILRSGGRVKIVLTNPLDSNSILIQGDRKQPSSDHSLVQGLINSTIRDLRAIKRDIPTGHMEVGLINRPLDERIHVINPGRKESQAYLKLYPFKHSNQNGIGFGGLYFVAEKSDTSQVYAYRYYSEKFLNYFQASTKLEMENL